MQKHYLETRPDGLTVITIPMPHTETITTSLMFNAGARYERTNKWGLAHFFEHMLFNGSRKYPDSKSLSEDLDALGAIQNAYTSQEPLSLWTKGAHTAADKIFEIISELAIHPTFPEEGILKERRVIVEELRMYQDDPESWLGDEWSQWLLCGQKPAKDPLGREDDINNFTREDVLDHFKLFNPQNGVCVTAGNITHENHLALVDKYLKFKNPGKIAQGPDIDIDKLSSEKVILISRKELTQANIELGTSVFGIDDADLPVVRIINAILSGGMSTRLFQELREKSHLCYKVHGGGIHYSDFGLWSIDGGMNIDNVEKSVMLILDEIRKLREEKVLPVELEKAKTNTHGKIAIAAEDTQFWSDFFARRYLATGQVKTVDDIIIENKKVTADDIMRVAQKYFSPERLRLGVIGPFDNGLKTMLEKLMS